jgi:hypothetical protein
MTRQITCRYCSGLIEAHFELFAHAACARPAPTLDTPPDRRFDREAFDPGG